MGFWRRHALSIVALVTAAAGLAAGMFDTSALLDPGADAFQRWMETRNVPSYVSSVVEIQITADNWKGQASGVILHTLYIENQKKWHTYILTAAHVVSEDADSTDTAHASGQDANRCIQPSDERIGQEIHVLGEKAEVLKYDTNVDLALIKIVTPAYPRLFLQERYVDIQPVALSTHIPKPAEEVWAIGFPGDRRMITRGYVGQADGDELSHSAAIRPGNSGGGVFQDGKLLGINLGVICDPTRGSDGLPVIAVGAEAILRFLGNEYGDLAKTDEIMPWIAGMWR